MSDSWIRYVEDPNPWQAPRLLPGPVETERVRVRLYEKGDGPKLFAAISRDRDALLPHMTWAITDHQDVDDTVHYVEKYRRLSSQEDCRDFPMGIFDRGSGEIIGGTGFHRIRADRREVEIGYWIRGDRHGEGLCTEAVGALISSALLSQSSGGWGFRRVLIYNAVHNVGSRRVCEKLGLRLEMRLRKERYFGPPGVTPGYVDMLGFAILDEEWDSSINRARQDISWTGP